MNIFHMKKMLLFCSAIIFLFVLCFSRLGHAEETLATFPAELTGDQLYEQGIALCDQEKYQEARPCFEEATKRKSNFDEAYYQLGVCYVETRQFDKAKRSLLFAKTLTQNQNLRNKVDVLIAKIVKEVEKEKQKEGTENINPQEPANKEENSNKIITDDNPVDLVSEIKREYYSGYRIQSETSYKNNVRDGEFKTYHDNGQISGTGYYVRGMKNGTFKTFRKNGVQKTEEIWKNDALNGKQIMYDPKYSTKEWKVFAGVYNFKNGVLDGTQYLYAVNGASAGDRNYKNGILNGWQSDYSLSKGPGGIAIITSGSRRYYENGEEKIHEDIQYDEKGRLKRSGIRPIPHDCNEIHNTWGDSGDE